MMSENAGSHLFACRKLSEFDSLTPLPTSGLKTNGLLPFVMITILFPDGELTWHPIFEVI